MEDKNDTLVLDGPVDEQIEKLVQDNMMLRMTVEEQHQTICQQVQKLMQENQVIHGLQNKLELAKEKIQVLEKTVKELEQEKGGYADMVQEQKAYIDHYIKHD